MLLVEQWRYARKSLSRSQTVIHLLGLYLETCCFVSDVNYRPAQSQAEDIYSLRYWFPHVDFTRIKPADVIRIAIQVVWLILFNQSTAQVVETLDQQHAQTHPLKGRLQRGKNKLLLSLRRWQKAYGRLHQRLFHGLDQSTKLSTQISGTFRVSLVIVISIVIAFVVTIPMEAAQQAVMLLFFWALALWVRDVNKRSALILMVIVSILVSTRYLYWRVTQTINWDVPMDTALSLTLLSAELYAWTILILGYIQTIWPLQRHVASLPSDTRLWPTIDVYIPTYNEPLAVVRPTIYAAKTMDWPADKINVYLLDDGKRAEFARFAKEVGVGYIARADNTHAKAGNLNHALAKTSGDYITIFDCDHIPTRSFLQLAIGWFFSDEKLALLQTPHHFFSPDPFEKNLSVFRAKPNEGELFYGLIQDGNDIWNASFFCGSCAVLKRGPLEEIKGIAVETVTEDAHTALKLHRLGYTSAYLNIPQAAGLATESLSAHIGQRIRWARGMAQIFRLDNPFWGRGLNLGQRICYANAMLYFLNGLPRMIFVLAPLAFLLLHSYIVFAPAVMIALYAIPHIVHSYLTNSKNQGKFRHSFWAEMYETALAWYILRPTIVALISPEHGKFNVTQKGGNTPNKFFDWEVSTPYLVLVGLSLIGFGFGLWRLFTGPADEVLTVVLNLVWVLYNLTILGGAAAVAEEAKQVRRSNRVQVNRPVTVETQSEHAYAAELIDFSEQGLGIKVPTDCRIEEGQVVSVTLPEGPSRRTFSAQVVSHRGQVLGMLLQIKSHAEHQAYIRATFARADAWVGWRDETVVDRPIQSFREVMAIGFRGYLRIANNLIPRFKPFFDWIEKVGRKLRTYLPYYPGEKVERDLQA